MTTARNNFRRKRNRGRRRRGSAAVEFAIAFPILLLFLIFMWEFARAEMIRQTAETAAYEGARQAIVVGGTPQDAQNTVREIMQAVGIKDTEVDVSPSVITNTTSAVEVSVTVPMRSNAWITPLFFEDLNVHSKMKLLR